MKNIRELTGDSVKFLKNWTLPLAIVTGITAYLIYDSIPALASAGPFLHKFVGIAQPAMLFSMLFLSFCKIPPHDMRPRKWHAWLLLFQIISFSLLAVVLILLPDFHGSILIEGAMLCLICPTATAAAVITGKLGGNMSGLVTYTILINMAVSIAVPVVVPFIHPSAGITFLEAAGLIMAQVFPLLIAPCLLAFVVRYAMPKFHSWILKSGNLAFYIWGVSLAVAMAVTTRSIVHSTVPAIYEIGLGAVSLACCALQFWAGKKIGGKYGDAISAGQSLGQKNTVFAIWMGYTFMTPVTSVAGGFYCIWHNIFNSWQLYRKRKESEAGTMPGKSL